MALQRATYPQEGALLILRICVSLPGTSGTKSWGWLSLADDDSGAVLLRKQEQDDDKIEQQAERDEQNDHMTLDVVFNGTVRQLELNLHDDCDITELRAALGEALDSAVGQELMLYDADFDDYFVMNDMWALREWWSQERKPARLSVQSAEPCSDVLHDIVVGI